MKSDAARRWQRPSVSGRHEKGVMQRNAGIKSLSYEFLGQEKKEQYVSISRKYAKDQRLWVKGHQVISSKCKGENPSQSTTVNPESRESRIHSRLKEWQRHEAPYHQVANSLANPSLSARLQEFGKRSMLNAYSST